MREKATRGIGCRRASPAGATRTLEQRDTDLLKRAQEFQSKDPEVAQEILAPDFGRDGRCFTWNQAGRSGRRGGNCELNELVQPKHVRRGNAGAACADIQCFCELYEFCACRVGPPQKNRYLNPYARTGPRLRSFGGPRFVHLFQTQIPIHSTQELVQIEQVTCQVKLLTCLLK